MIFFNFLNVKQVVKVLKLVRPQPHYDQLVNYISFVCTLWPIISVITLPVLCKFVTMGTVNFFSPLHLYVANRRFITNTSIELPYMYTTLFRRGS